MLARSLLLAISASVSLVAAQGETRTKFYPDISQVSTKTLDGWCPSEEAVCPQLCNGAASANQCFVNTLTYTCKCADGSKPDMSLYAGTLESLACEAYVSQCVAGNTTSPKNQDACLAIHCGKKNPASATKSSGGSGGSVGSGGSGSSKTQSSSTPKPTSGGGGPHSGSPGASTTKNSGSSVPTGNAAAGLVQQAAAIATPAVAGVVLAAFGLAL